MVKDWSREETAIFWIVNDPPGLQGFRLWGNVVSLLVRHYQNQGFLMSEQPGYCFQDLIIGPYIGTIPSTRTKQNTKGME